MFLSENNFDTAYIQSYCQLLYCLSKTYINIFGSTVRNWIIPCYVYDISPFRMDSVSKVMRTHNGLNLNNEIDLWVVNNLNTVVIKVQNMVENLGYDTEMKCSKDYNNIQIQILSMRTKFGSEIVFYLKFYGANEFLHVDFDVNNLYVKCNPVSGIEGIDLLYQTPNQSRKNFGYLTSKEKSFHSIIYGILNRKCNHIPLDPQYKVDKVQYFTSTEKMINQGFQIMNSPLLKEVVDNPFSIMKCSICFEDMESSRVQTKCNHIFHSKCLFTWWKKQVVLSCPTCRKVFLLQ